MWDDNCSIRNPLSPTPGPGHWTYWCDFACDLLTQQLMQQIVTHIYTVVDHVSKQNFIGHLNNCW